MCVSKTSLFAEGFRRRLGASSWKVCLLHEQQLKYSLLESCLQYITIWLAYYINFMLMMCSDRFFNVLYWKKTTVLPLVLFKCFIILSIFFFLFQLCSFVWGNWDNPAIPIGLWHKKPSSSTDMFDCTSKTDISSGCFWGQTAATDY